MQILSILTKFFCLNFQQLKNKLYLDDIINKKTEQANASDLSFIDRFGDLAPFLKNDMRLIWRNKRPKTVFFMSFIFLFYATIFYSNPTYQKMPTFLIFGSLFVTGGFLMNFGQFIPAWDSSYYKLLMTQNISYKKYLLSKWNLMVFVTAISTVLSVPYVYFGWDVMGIILAGSFFNMGLNTWTTLFGGLLNKTPMKLNVKAKAFENTQSFSLNQFLLIVPKMALPVFLYWLPAKFLGPTAGYFTLAGAGIAGIIFKHQIANRITALYLKQKHETIEAFNK